MDQWQCQTFSAGCLSSLCVLSEGFPGSGCVCTRAHMEAAPCRWGHCACSALACFPLCSVGSAPQEHRAGSDGSCMVVAKGPCVFHTSTSKVQPHGYLRAQRGVLAALAACTGGGRPRASSGQLPACRGLLPGQGAGALAFWEAELAT